MLKEMEDNLEFNPVMASDLAGILEQSALQPDQLKKVKESSKKLDANPELAGPRKFEKDLPQLHRRAPRQGLRREEGGRPA